MTTDGHVTAFVTGAEDFIGAALVELLVARGCRVVGLAGTPEGADRLRRTGAVPVMGDLLQPGRWQDEASADWVFHVPAQPACRSSATPSRRTDAMGRERVLMDAHLLDAVAAGPTRRIVYVANTSWYGTPGSRAVTEDAPPRPMAWGRSFSQALGRLEGYLIAGLPIVTALPGWVYGNGSWFRDRVIEPVMASRFVLEFGTIPPLVSYIHVEDCARALIHLADRGESGSRYFLVNTDPIRTHEFAKTFSRLSNRPMRAWRVPSVAARVLLGAAVAEHLTADAVFSNMRLRGTGFGFRYPKLDDGVRQVLGALDESRVG